LAGIPEPQSERRRQSSAAYTENADGLFFGHALQYHRVKVRHSPRDLRASTQRIIQFFQLL